MLNNMKFYRSWDWACSFSRAFGHHWPSSGQTRSSARKKTNRQRSGVSDQAYAQMITKNGCTKQKSRRKQTEHQQHQDQNTRVLASHTSGDCRRNTNIQTTQNRDIPQAFQHPKIIACTPQGQNQNPPEMLGGIQDILLGLWWNLLLLLLLFIDL